MRPQVDNHNTLAFPRRRLLCGPLHRKNVVVNRDFDKIKQQLLFWRGVRGSRGQLDNGVRARPRRSPWRGRADYEAIEFGMMMSPGKSVRMMPMEPPSMVVIVTEVVKAETRQATSFVVTFDRPVDPATYEVDAEWPLADAYDLVIQTAPTRRMFAGQTVRLRIQAVNNRGKLLTLGGVAGHLFEPRGSRHEGQ